MERALAEGKTNAAEVEAIWRLTSLPTFEERFVVPAMERETAVEVYVSGARSDLAQLPGSQRRRGCRLSY